MTKVRILAIPLVIIAMMIGVMNNVHPVLADDPPVLPSSFYGEVHFSNGAPSNGDTVNAYIGDSTSPAAMAAIAGSDPLVYSINVPGVASDENAAVTFKINDRIAAIGTWHSGTNVKLNFHPPAANAHGPYVTVVDEALTLSGTATDWGSDISTYAWDLNNDGAYDDSTSQNPSITFSITGTKNIGLKVTDSKGGVGTASVNVVVVSIGNLTGQTYDGTAKSITVDGMVSPYEYTVGYTPSPAVNAGSYNVVVSIYSDSGHTNLVGTITKTMVIAQKSASVTPNPESKIFGAGDPTFTGNLDGFISSDGITGNYNRAPGEDAGPYTISATLSPLGKLDNYDITYNTAIFTINPKGITVTADSGKTKVYGAADPLFTYTSSEAVSFTGALSRDSGANVGSYAITIGSLSAGSNYAITFVSADFTITPLPVTVTVTSGQSKVFGTAADPVFAYSASIVSPVPTFTGTLARTAGENVGPYAINQGSLSAGSNYSIIFVGANFSITPKPITVTATSGLSKVVGAADPVFTYTSSDTGVSFNGVLSRVAGEGIGTYAITINTLSAGTNYTITFVSADFTIVGVQHSISLVVGWNLVSFSVHPTSTAIADVLADIAGKYSLVYAWDAAGGHNGSGNWMKYDPMAPIGNTLLTLDEKMGFWINMTVVDNLDVIGNTPTSTNISLRNDVGGWNLVGYPSAASLPLTNLNVPPNSTLLYAFHANDLTDPWKLYDITAESYANDLKVLTPGWAYWVFVNADGTWSVTY